MKIYLAGPMSGIPQFNFPAFDAAAADLRKRGFGVVSPSELDDPAFRARVLTANGTEPDLLGEWGNCLARDVKLIADGGIDGIVLLPAWYPSRGARLEATVGLLCGLKFALYQPDLFDGIEIVGRDYVLRHIQYGFAGDKPR